MHVAFVRSCSESQAAILATLEEKGHNVHCFDDAREALAAIKSDSALDMLITGALTAPISGLEICWEARLLAGEDRPALYSVCGSGGRIRNQDRSARLWR